MRAMKKYNREMEAMIHTLTKYCGTHIQYMNKFISDQFAELIRVPSNIHLLTKPIECNIYLFFIVGIGREGHDGQIQ